MKKLVTMIAAVVAVAVVCCHTTLSARTFLAPTNQVTLGGETIKLPAYLKVGEVESMKGISSVEFEHNERFGAKLTGGIVVVSTTLEYYNIMLGKHMLDIREADNKEYLTHVEHPSHIGKVYTIMLNTSNQMEHVFIYKIREDKMLLMWVRGSIYHQTDVTKLFDNIQYGIVRNFPPSVDITK